MVSKGRQLARDSEAARRVTKSTSCSNARRSPDGPRGRRPKVSSGWKRWMRLSFVTDARSSTDWLRGLVLSLSRPLRHEPRVEHGQYEERQQRGRDEPADDHRRQWALHL